MGDDCKQCRFYRLVPWKHGDYTECRRRAPVTIDADNMDAATSFPAAIGPCGEFEPAPEAS